MMSLLIVGFGGGEGGGEGEGRMDCRCPFSLGERYGFYRLIKTKMKNFPLNFISKI